MFGLGDGGCRDALKLAVKLGMLSVGAERIEQAKGSFQVYRQANPAVRVVA